MLHIPQDHTVVNIQNKSEAERFLKWLDPNATFFTFQTFHDKKRGRLARILHGTLDQHWATLVRLNSQGAGIYVTISETDGKGREKDNVVRVRGLFADLDGAPLQTVIESTPAPHAAVESSPGRFHAYWKVEGVSVGDFEGLQEMLAARFDGDSSVKDKSRVMRLPGFLHNKGKPFLSRIVQMQEGVPTCKASDFEEDNSFTAYAILLGRRGIDVEARLAAMEHKGAGETAINVTQRDVSAKLISAGWTEDAVVDRLMKETERVAPKNENWNWAEEETQIRSMCRRWEKKLKAREKETVKANFAGVEPFDFWDQLRPPPLPRGLLPKLIEDYAFQLGDVMGADPAGTRHERPDCLRRRDHGRHQAADEAANRHVVGVGADLVRRRRAGQFDEDPPNVGGDPSNQEARLRARPSVQVRDEGVQ